ncbi:MAG: beta-lactamase family protein [Balneolaceae bacterium]|nr:beta-lactamase family protein [Balneolaceae bacterium]
MKKIFLIPFLLILPLSLFSQSGEKDYSEAFNLIEVWLDAQTDYDMLPGISASAVEGDELLWSGAFGLANRETELPYSTSTLGSICSISKLFTSIAIMTLYEDGKLRLDDRIEDLLPWYNLEQRFSDTAPITVRSLLTHSAGLPREGNLPYWVGPVYNFPERDVIIDELSNQETLYPSATYFQYSNLGMMLLGEIVAEVSGEPFEDYVNRVIFEPLNLNDTRTYMPEELHGSELAMGYSPMMRDGTRETVNYFNANGMMAAAGFTSNVLDLADFARWQIRLLDSDSADILKPSTLRYMQNVHYTDPGWDTTWGLGFAVSRGGDGSKWVSHGGYCPGFQSTWRLNPDSERAYSVIINANGVNPNKYAMGIHSILTKVPQSSADENSEDDNGVPDLSEYAGYFVFNHGEQYVTPWGDKLASLSLPTDNPGDNLTLYRHLEGDVFVRVRDDGSDGETLEFDRDEDGNIYQVRAHRQFIHTKIER